MSALRRLTEDELAQDRPMEQRLLNAAVRHLLYMAEEMPGFSEPEDRDALRQLRYYLNGEQCR